MSAAEVVTVTVQGEGGSVWDMDVPDPKSMAGERFAAQLASGALTIVESDGEAPEPPPDPEPVGEPGDTRPTKNASKADWKDYAIATGMDPDVAESMSRDELIEATEDED